VVHNLVRRLADQFLHFPAEQMEKQRLRLALFIAAEFGGERGAIVEALFRRNYGGGLCANSGAAPIPST